MRLSKQSMSSRKRGQNFAR